MMVFTSGVRENSFEAVDLACSLDYLVSCCDAQRSKERVVVVVVVVVGTSMQHPVQ
jgi:hypothetical protein